MKTKISVTVDKNLLRECEALWPRPNAGRSRLVEEALHLWRSRHLRDKLARDYRSYASEGDAGGEFYAPGQSEVALSDPYEG